MDPYETHARTGSTGGARMTGSVASGLDGVVVADTALSEVDGERGRLVIAGHDVEAIAGQRSVEELCRALGQQRIWAFEQLDSLGRALSAADGMDALRGGLAQLPTEGSAWDLAVRLTAATA